MTLIAVLQLSALSFGVYTIYQQRPYVAVVLDGRITSLHDYDLANGAPRAEIARLISGSKLRPPLLAVRPGKDGEEAAHMLVAEFMQSGFPKEFTERLEPVQAHWNITRTNGLVIPKRLEEASKNKLDAFYRKHNVQADAVTMLEVSGPFGGCIAAFHSADGSFIDYIDINAAHFGRGIPPVKKAAAPAAASTAAGVAASAASAAGGH